MNRRPPSRLSSFLSELRDRRVIRAAIVYAVVAFGVAQAADILAPGLSLPEWSLTLVLFLLLLGFPVAIALAWVFDVTPRGLERTTARRRAQPKPKPGGEPAATPSSDVRRFDSIAVLPLVDLSPGKDQEYFSDGLAEELLNVLTQVPGLRVPARTSSFAFKGQNADIREIGEKLDVETVLEGSVRKWENQLLITAQLIEVESGFHLWSDTYDRRLEDVFAIQREIARSIVHTLRGRLLGETETPLVKEATTDPEAYQLFLKAQHLGHQFTVEAYRKSSALLEQAVAKDPLFARAWATLAIQRRSLAYLGAEPAGEAMPRARAAAERALELDPALGEAYAARAAIATYTRDFDAAERDLRRALELGPSSARAHNAHGVLLSFLCRPAEAIAAFRRAAELDPLTSAPLTNLGNAFMSMGRPAEALAAYEQALELAPASGLLELNIAGALSVQGRHEEAIARAREVQARLPAREGSVLAVCLLRAGRRAEAEALLAELEGRLAEGKARAMDVAEVYALLGRRDAAFAALEDAIAANEGALLHLAAAEEFDPLREDPRWEPLLARAGFPKDAIRRSRELYELRKAAGAVLAGHVSSPDQAP